MKNVTDDLKKKKLCLQCVQMQDTRFRIARHVLITDINKCDLPALEAFTSNMFSLSHFAY